MRNKIMTLVATMLIAASCSHRKNAIPIGLETEVAATEQDILPFDAYPPEIFDSVLVLENKMHYQGKTLVLYDTLYTSVVQDTKPAGVVQAIKRGDYDIINMQTKKDVAMLLKRNGMYIYRVIVPETVKTQSILIDVASPDSAKIARYYDNHRTQQILNP